MGVESPLVQTAVKGGSWILLPTLWISLFFLVGLIGYYGIESIQSNSVEPLIKNVLFGVFASDHKISYLMDSFVFEHPYVSMFKSFSGFWNCIFEKISWGFQILQNLWFIFVFFILIYYLVDFMGGDMMPMFNKIFFVILIFVVFQFALGLMFYSYNNSDKICTGSSSDCLMLMVSHSFPFEGVWSFINHTFISKDFFNNVHQLNNNKFMQLISSIPNNVSVS